MKVSIKSLFMPMALVAAILIALLGGAYINLDIKCFFYSLSLTFKTILIALLPFIIMVFISHSLMKIGRGAVMLVTMIIPLIIISNMASTILALISGQYWLSASHFDCIVMNSEPTTSLTPWWNLTLPTLISNDGAMMIGVLLGLTGCMVQNQLLNRLSNYMIGGVNHFLNQIFVPLMPVFIFGFALNLQQSGVLQLVVTNYYKVLIGFMTLCFSYIILLYGLVNNGKINNWLKSLQNMLPALLTGFSTMSSAAALPLTLLATQKNARQPQDIRSKSDRGVAIVDAVVPLTVNVHLIGDCFAIPIFALAVMLSFGHGIPDWNSLLQFAGYFVMAKFAVAAVPGGGILVMLPILENYLNFTPEMLSVIMALYLLFDPVITGANILGNGAFALVCNKILTKVKMLRLSY